MNTLALVSSLRDTWQAMSDIRELAAQCLAGGDAVIYMHAQRIIDLLPALDAEIGRLQSRLVWMERHEPDYCTGGRGGKTTTQRRTTDPV